MRTTVMLGAGLALMTAGAAEAQTPGAPYPAPGMGMQRPPLPQPPRAPVMGQRWGSQVGGRWWGGVNAPGGWAAYRQPYRGYRLPGYWVAPRFYVTDWSRYGLYAPTGGYSWVRYYDDAVLVDGGGNVTDWRGGLDWNGDDRGGDGYVEERRGDTGVGGAIAGAVVGGVAGNVIAGRGNRLGGTLIGAGVGTALGYGVARATSHDRRGPPPGYGYDDRGPPPEMRDGPPPRAEEQREERRWTYRRDRGAGYPPPLPPGHPPVSGYGNSGWSSQGGGTTVTVTGGGYGDGYRGNAPVIVSGGGYGSSVTTVTIQSAPVVTTTTTTEIIEDRVTYRRAAVRRVVRRPVRYVCPPVRVRHHWTPPAVRGS